MPTISDPCLPDGAHPPDEEQRPGCHTGRPLGIRSIEAPTPGVPGTAGVQSGGGYIHCGEPMHAASSGLRSIYAPMTTEPVPAGQTSEDVLEVYLRTRVLRCGCGFQMEIPE
jgi:hypothetical protein